MQPTRNTSLARRLAFVLALGLTSCSAPATPAAAPSTPGAAVAVKLPAPPPEKPPERPMRQEDRFAVASENATGVEVARAVLEAGGNAADATVGGVLVACAAQPVSCGLGGGGTAIFRRDDGSAQVIDFRETAPRGLRRAEHLGKPFKASKRGTMVGVPGLVAGLAELHRAAGKLPWAEIVNRAADAVERGLPLSAYSAQSIAWNATWMRSDPLARVLWPVEAESRVGEILKNPGLVAALRIIAREGGAGFYEGPIAKDVVDTARAAGSRLTATDLSQYRAIVREPLRVSVAGFELLLSPPPAAGGILALQTLEVVSETDLKRSLEESADLVHVVAESFRASLADRVLLVGDPDFTKADVRSLLDESAMRARRARIKPTETTMPKLPSIADGGTLHFVAVDESGLQVSLTASLSSQFGAKLVTKSGFSLNDTLSEFTMDDYGQKIANRGPNFPRGGARPVSSQSPLIVLKNGQPVLVAGASGGLRGATALSQVLLAHLRQNRPLAEAVAAPRIHVGFSGALKVEPPLVSLRAELLGRGEVIAASAPSFSSVVAVGLREQDGVRVLEPIFDPRKGGAVTIGRESVEAGTQDAGVRGRSPGAAP